MNNYKCICNMYCCHDKYCSNHDDGFYHRCPSLQANLTGIKENLNFQLFRLKGCRVEVHVECSGQNQVIVGRICNVGINFFSIYVDEGQPGEKIVTVMSERICLVEWQDKNCNHCIISNQCDSYNLRD